MARALPRAPEMSLPFAIEVLEGPLELVPHELSPDGLKAYRPPSAPFSSTVPLMLGASRSNLAWPNTTWPSTVNLTTARLHRSPVDVAVPVHSPSYGPAASALLNCDRSSTKAAVATMCGEFMRNSHCCTSLYDSIMARLPLRRMPCTSRS